MEQQTYETITSQLSKGRSPLHYFRDYYALYLLELVSRDGVAL